MSKRWFSSNRVTPEPDGGRIGVVRMDDRVGDNVNQGWGREIKRDVFRAMSNRVELPDYSFQQHQRKVDRQKTPLAPTDPSWRTGDIIEIMGDEPSVLVDRDGYVIAWQFPKFLKPQSLSYLNEISDALAMRQFPAHERARGKIRGLTTAGSRGGRETYTTTCGVWGTATYCTGWHEQRHEHDRSFAPSSDLVEAITVAHSVHRDYFFTSLRDITGKINDLVDLVNPRLHNHLVQLKEGLSAHPSCMKYASIWGSIFPGHSFICNRQTGTHVDRNGLRRGFEAILAGGNFSGGALYLDDVKARLGLSPGTLVLFDGTALRHTIEKWTGAQRFSHTLFVHRSAFQELEIPYSLNDISIGSIKARLATPTYQPAPVARKRPGTADPNESSKRSRNNQPRI